jgi:hypothetical protein
MNFRRPRLVLGAVLLVTALLPAQLRADLIPYGSVGTENPITYSFTAAASGDIIAYFAGSHASFINTLGLLVNGVDRGIYGLNNHTSLVGDSLNFGAVNAGDVLTFVLRIDVDLGIIPPGSKVYSDPSLNAPYDSIYGGSSPGLNHIYSTAYTATSPILPGVPVGTYVAFEDLPAHWPPDWNYDDEDFVFTNVRAVSTPDAGSTLLLLGGAIGTLGLFIRRRD